MSFVAAYYSMLAVTIFRHGCFFCDHLLLVRGRLDSPPLPPRFIALLLPWLLAALQNIAKPRSFGLPLFVGIGVVALSPLTY